MLKMIFLLVLLTAALFFTLGFAYLIWDLTKEGIAADGMATWESDPGKRVHDEWLHNEWMAALPGLLIFEGIAVVAFIAIMFGYRIIWRKLCMRFVK